MRVLVTADTHLSDPGSVDLPLRDYDAVVHAGDFTSTGVHDYFVEHELYAVHGNADSPDLKSRLPEHKAFKVEGVRIAVLHGHTVSSNQELSLQAAESGADLLIHAHTHQPSFIKRGVALLNPGSPTRPRGGPASYAELRIMDGDYEGEILGLDGTVIRSFR